jgi:protein SCO1/2
MKPQKGTQGAKMKKVLLCFLCLFVAILAYSCKRSNERRYELTGKIVAVEPDKHQVTVAHDEIAGYMPAMTMPYTVRDQIDLKELGPNDTLSATLVVDGSRTWLENLIVTHVTTNGPALPGVTIAKEGDEVPNFTLRNQNNREIHVRDYRGKVLLLTFIYTRCPQPDYCTLMSNNFAQIDRTLGQDPALYEKTHLLSISIDPSYDTPEVLKSYGAAHTERYENETFAHWEFAGGTSEQVKKIAEYFGLTYFPEKDQIVHALRTVIVSPEGKIVKIYSGNEWKPEEVVDEMRRGLTQKNAD